MSPIPAGIVASARAASGGSIAALSGIRFYAQPPAGTDGSALTSWVDTSPAGQSATIVTTDSTPTVKTGATPNGASAVRFAGGYAQWGPPLFSGSDDGELWVVARSDPAYPQAGSWMFSTALAQSHLPYGGLIYDSFGSDTRLSGAGPGLNVWFIYRVNLTGTTLTGSVNGSTIFSGTVAKAWRSTDQRVGESPTALRSDVAAFILRDRESDATDSALIRAELLAITGV